jgi:hypothetical protein
VSLQQAFDAIIASQKRLLTGPFTFPSQPTDLKFLLDNVERAVWEKLDSLIKYTNNDYDESSDGLKK